MNPAPSPRPAAISSIIGCTTLSKFLMNLIRRLVYPFAPEIARGLDVPLTAVTTAIAANQAAALMGPLSAGFADRYGYKLLMLFAMAMVAVGSFAAGLIPIYSVFMIAMVLAGLAKSIFDPSLQAFIGSFVPYAHRGRFIGITEMSWAGCTLIGIPAAGLIIEKLSWQTPFWIIGLLSLVFFFLILKFMPREKPPAPSTSSPGGTGSQSIKANWKRLVQTPQVLGYLGFSFFMALANDALFVIYGAWLEQSYGLSLAAIGLGTVFIGVSELLAEGSTALFADRIGLKRAVIGGAALTAVSYLLLPLADTRLALVLAALFWVFFNFEFTIVTAMGLGTELVPNLRASTMSAFYAIGGMGRVAGAFAGGMIWSSHGIWGISLVSGISTLLALGAICLGFYVNKKPCPAF